MKKNSILLSFVLIIISIAVFASVGRTNKNKNYLNRVIYGDTDGNGEIQAVDASLILQYIVGIIDIFPIQDSFVFYGDTRLDEFTPEPRFRIKIAECIDEINPKYICNSGDFILDGDNQEQWDSWFEDCGFILENREFYPVHGNHDGSVEMFLENMGEYIPEDANWDQENNWYSLDRKGIHFVALDTDFNEDIDIIPGSAQYEWFIDDMANIDDDIETTILIIHHPPYGTGRHSSHEPHLQEYLVPLIQEYDIKLVFGGHNHSYEHLIVDGVNYVVSAGGGAQLYEQDMTDDDMQYSEFYAQEYHFCAMHIVDDLISINVIDTNFVVLDHIEIELE